MTQVSDKKWFRSEVMGNLGRKHDNVSTHNKDKVI